MLEDQLQESVLNKRKCQGILSLICHHRGCNVGETCVLEINGNRVKSWAARPMFMTRQQCRKEYPLLYAPIDEAVGRGEFDFYRGPDEYTALVTARIKNNALTEVGDDQNTASRSARLRSCTTAIRSTHEMPPFRSLRCT